MNIEDKKTFIRLVQSSASIKAYRACGVGHHNMQHHLGQLAQYERDVAAHDSPPKVEGETLLAELPKELIEEIAELRANPRVGSTLESLLEEEPCCEDPTNCPPECPKEECDDA
jgi:hypothetical protein